MIKNRFVYLGMFLFSFGLFVFQADSFSHAFFLLVVLLPALSFLVLFMSTRLASYKIEMGRPHIPRGDVCEVTVWVGGDFIFLPKLVSLEGNFSFSPKRKKLFSYISDGEASFRYRTEHCGKFEMDIKKVCTYDYFGIFRMRVAGNRTETFYVLPEVHQLAPLELRGDGEDLIEQYSLHQKGDDYTEVFEVRPYVPGDTRHQIHWKITSKMGEYYVREGSLPLATSVLIEVNPYLSEDGEVSLQLLDLMLDGVFSVSAHYVAQGLPHTIRLLGPKSYMDFSVLTGDDYVEAMMGLLSKMKYTKNNNLARLQSSGFSKAIFFSTELPEDAMLGGAADQVIIPVLQRDEAKMGYAFYTAGDLYSGFRDIAI